MMRNLQEHLRDLNASLRDAQGRRNWLCAGAACAFGYWLAVMLVAVVFSKEVAAAEAGYFRCPPDTVRVKRVLKPVSSGSGLAVQVEVSCEPIPMPEYVHPTLVKEAPPIEIPVEEE